MFDDQVKQLLNLHGQTDYSFHSVGCLEERECENIAFMSDFRGYLPSAELPDPGFPSPEELESKFAPADHSKHKALTTATVGQLVIFKKSEV